MATIYEDDNRDLRCRNCNALIEGDALGDLPKRCPCCDERLDWRRFTGLAREPEPRTIEHKPESPSKAQRIEWMNEGLCKDCGRPVDHPDRFVRCKACRTQRTERQRKLYAPPTNLAQLMAPRPAAPEAADSAKPKISAPAHSGKFERVSKEVDEARRKWREQLNRCETCAYVTYAGAGVWFCPLPYCQKV